MPYIGEIRLFAGNFAPVGWEFCSGQLLPISENETLFVVLGTAFGGDGESTFALPDLRGRVPVHVGAAHAYSTSGGVEEVTLTINQIPSHTHAFTVLDAPANTPNPGNNRVAKSTQADIFFADLPSVNMNAGSIGLVGGSQPHENMLPFLGLNYIISLYGVFPTQ